MEKGTFTSQYFNCKEDYNKVKSALEKRVEELGGERLFIAPQLNNLMVIQGVFEMEDTDYAEAEFKKALDGVETEYNVMFIIVEPDSNFVIQLDKLRNGYVFSREMYPDAE